MISNDALKAMVNAHGRDLQSWPLVSRWQVSLACRCSPAVKQQWQALQSEERCFDAILHEVADIEASAALQRRLIAISARPQAQHPSGGRQTPVWQLGMSTALASVLLGFALGAGGVLVPDDSVAEGYFDSGSAAYEVSGWLAGEEE